MLIHEEIRDEVIERLKPALSSHVKRFYSGRILGLNPSEQCPAISVYLEDISLDQTCLCDSELNATLNIAIYLKPHSGEDELDNIAELIAEQPEDLEGLYLHDEDGYKLLHEGNEY